MNNWEDGYMWGFTIGVCAVLIVLLIYKLL